MSGTDLGFLIILLAGLIEAVYKIRVRKLVIILLKPIIKSKLIGKPKDGNQLCMGVTLRIILKTPMLFFFIYIYIKYIMKYSRASAYYNIPRWRRSLFCRQLWDISKKESVILILDLYKLYTLNQNTLYSTYENLKIRGILFYIDNVMEKIKLYEASDKL